MKKQLLTVALIFSCIIGYSQNTVANEFATVETISKTQVKITSLQPAPSRLKITLPDSPDSTVIITSYLATGSSTMVTLPACGRVLVYPVDISNGKAPCQLEAMTCSVLPVTLVYFNALKPDKDGRVYIEFNFGVPPIGATYKTKILLTNGTIKIIDIPLTNRKSDGGYFYYIEPEKLK